MLGENRGGVIKLLFIEHLECDRPFTGYVTCMVDESAQRPCEVHTFSVPIFK